MLTLDTPVIRRYIVMDNLVVKKTAERLFEANMDKYGQHAIQR